VLDAVIVTIWCLATAVVVNAAVSRHWTAIDEEAVLPPHLAAALSSPTKAAVLGAVTGAVENLVFFGGAQLLSTILGLDPLLTTLAAAVAWVLLHGHPPRMLVALPMAIAFSYDWLTGNWIVAVAAHALYDALALYTLSRYV